MIFAVPIHSPNLQRLEMLADVPAHIFWGFRSCHDFLKENRVQDGTPIVIADKGFIDRFKTVYSINWSWGRLGRFVVNPSPAPLEIPELEEEPRVGVLELGQDVTDYSYEQDARDGVAYREWLEQWPSRRVRPHPKVARSFNTLEEDLAEVGHVVGLNTSALVAASLAGKRVRAFGPHSMANGINGVRLERLKWLRSIEWDRRDPSAPAAIAAALATPELASECPESESQTPTTRTESRKKTGKTQPGRRARGKRGGRSSAGSDESV